MRSYRFMFSRRWIVFAIIVVLLAYATWWLGDWQFGRLHDRKASNAIVSTNEGLDPSPVEDVLRPGVDASTRDEWRLVTASGTYDVDDTVIVRYRSNDRGVTGVDVVVPLVTADGTALLVDRGFVETSTRSVQPDEVPAPPQGQVSVTGWVRVDGTGSSTAVADASTRAISSARIGAAIGQQVYGGFVDVKTETPPPQTPLERTALPELNNGPHFFYGLQWWFFGVLGVFGFFYLARDERKRGPAPARPPKVKKQRQTNVNAAYQRQRPAASGASDAGGSSTPGDPGSEPDPAADVGRAGSGRSQDVTGVASSKNWVR